MDTMCYNHHCDKCNNTTPHCVAETDVSMLGKLYYVYVMFCLTCKSNTCKVSDRHDHTGQMSLDEAFHRF